MSTPVERAHAIASVIEAHADEGERNRRLPAPTVDALRNADLMRMFVPTAYGGPDVDPVTAAQTIETLAHADGAAGWCSMIASTTSSLASFLPPATAELIYGDPTIVTGGVFAPNGTGTANDDGFDVTGRWAWGSGTQHCDWTLGGAMCDDATFRLCWFPHHDLTFYDTWHTSGMRGSGSLDYSVERAHVAADFTMQPGVTRPVVDAALARFPNFTLLAACVGAVGLGIARRAMDELLAVASGKYPQYSKRTLAHNGYTQIEYARAEGQLRSARSFLHTALAEAWEITTAGDPVPLDARAQVRLAATHAAATAAAVTDTAFTLAGGTAVYDTSPLGRCQRDAHVVTQHIQTAPKTYELTGKVLLGVDADTQRY